MIKHYTKLQKIPEIGISVLEKTIYGEYPTHWHDFTEMEFILSGGGKYIIDGKQHEIRENMLFFMTPVNFHSVRVSRGGARIVNIKFSESLCDGSTLFSLIAKNKENAVIFPQSDAMFIRALLQQMKDACLKENEEYLKATLGVLLLKTAQNASAVTDGSLSYAQTAMLYVLENFRSDITLSSAAKHIGLSVSYLSKVFADENGITFKKYLDGIRFDYAKKLLTYSDMSVSEICAESGFDDYANFMRAFKQNFGMSPGNYRSIYRGTAQKTI